MAPTTDGVDGVEAGTKAESNPNTDDYNSGSTHSSTKASHTHSEVKTTTGTKPTWMLPISKVTFDPKVTTRTTSKVSSRAANQQNQNNFIEVLEMTSGPDDDHARILSGMVDKGEPRSSSKQSK